MDALIIGAGGFVGGYLIQELQSQGKSVAAAKLPHESVRIGGCEVCDLDVCNENAVRMLLQLHRPAQIYYLEEQSSAADAWKDPQHTVDVNIKGVLHLLEAVRSVEDYYPRILLVGSGEEYGHPRAELISEDAALHPTNIYAVTKACQNMIGSVYAGAYGMGIVMVRAFSHIGVGQSPQYAAADLALKIAEMEAGFREPVMKVSNLAAKRDFSDIRDMVRAYVLLMERGRSGETYNVGSGRQISVQEMLEMLTELSTVPIEIVQEERTLRRFDAVSAAADITKLQEDTGWKPEYAPEDTLRAMLNHNRRNFGIPVR
ncbi:MAG: NAD-dependent epimerase/dehydratase family protein [Ruminococcus sp.]|nr:NAD-dependent epimerase/dehydratase family protein [Ruminococcus sp.]